MGADDDGAAGGGAGDGDGTAMSSVLEARLTSTTRTGDADGVNNGNGVGGAVPPHPTLAIPPSKDTTPRQRRPQGNGRARRDDGGRGELGLDDEGDEYDDLDTLMTKPRLISFGADDDDVSALHGAGGASVIIASFDHHRRRNNGGRESRMGTFASLRRKHATARGGGGGAGIPEEEEEEEDAMDAMDAEEGRAGGGRDASTFQSRGVTTILDEIGLGRGGGRGGDYEGGGASEEEENKGHGVSAARGRGGWRQSSTRGGGRRDDHRDGGVGRKSGLRGGRQHHDGTAWGEMRARVSRFRRREWTILAVSASFVLVQLTTFKRRNVRDTMDHLDWRARNRNRRAGSGVGYDDGGGGGGGGGLSDAMRDVAMGNVVGGGGGGALRDVNDYDPRWQRGGGDDGIGGDGDGLGGLSRMDNNAPLTRWDGEREQEEVMLDDALVDEGANNDRLRGEVWGGGGGGMGGGGRPLDMKRAVTEMDEMAEAQQQQQLEHQQLRQRITQQLGGGDVTMGGNSQFRQQPQQQRDQRGRMTMGGGNVARQSQQQLQPPGDTPLSRMADALDENDGLGPGGTDSLSVIDPRPVQKLTYDIVPDRFGVFADLKTPYVVGRDTPFFWHVPRSGGVVVKTMLSHCLGQTLAAEVGESGGHAKDMVRLRRLRCSFAG